MDRSVDILVGRVRHARSAYYADGFELPAQYLSVIEAIRLRPDGERDYQYYLDEVLREYTALPHPWQLSVRKLLKPEQRSPYLDMLAGRANEGAVSLDPNFNLFVKINPNEWMDLLGRFRAQKQRELEQHLKDLDARRGHATGLVPAIVEIAQTFNFCPRSPSKARDQSIYLDNLADEGVVSSLKIVDLHSVNGRGNVIVQYFLSDFPGKPFGLDTFVPGGHIYYEWNKSPREVLFSFYAQCLFVSKLAHQLETN